MAFHSRAESFIVVKNHHFKKENLQSIQRVFEAVLFIITFGQKLCTELRRRSIDKQYFVKTRAGCQSSRQMETKGLLVRF